MTTPLRTAAFRLADARLDAWTEHELFWRWHFADGEASGLRSNFPAHGGEYAPFQGARIRTAEGPDGGGITEDVGYRNGLVYVSSSRVVCPDYDCDLSGMRAYHWRRRIDVALARTDPAAARIIYLAFRDPVPKKLLYLCPPTEKGPALSSLVELTPAARRAWTVSRSVKSLREWLERHAERAEAGNGDRQLLRELATAADVLLASAGREYGRWRKLESAGGFRGEMRGMRGMRAFGG